jgi:hypothetical protein
MLFIELYLNSATLVLSLKSLKKKNPTAEDYFVVVGESQEFTYRNWKQPIYNLVLGV